MPKKKQTRSRKSSKVVQPTRPAAPAREPGLIDRLKRNPLSVGLGIVVILSMVLALAADIVQSSRPPVLPITQTPAPFETPSAPTVTPAPTGTPAALMETPATGKETSVRKTYAAPPPMTIDTTKNYTATITTSKGTIKIQLLPQVAPNTVNAFVNLARDGFYDGLTFHRVEDWVVQGGDPRGDGTGGPGYTLKAEFNATKHITGTVAMARASDPNSAGSQFYIVKTPAPWLDGQYTVFGQTVEGMDVVNRLAKGDVMQKVTIEEK